MTASVGEGVPTGGPAPARHRPPILSRALVLRFFSVVGSSIGYFLPLAVIPTYASHAGSSMAGLANGALLLSTVLGELVTPRIVARTGYRWALAAGLFLLGAPALLLLASSSPALILGVNVVRGIGFAVAIVAGGALTAALIPSERRGEGLAVVGLVSGTASLVALPVGVWVAQQWGFAPVFVGTAAAPLLALVTIPALPARQASAGGRYGILAGLRNAALMRPAMIFAAATVASGVLITFLPLALDRRVSWVAPVAMFVVPGTGTIAKWIGGRLGDRHGPTRLLVPGIVLSVAGMAVLSPIHSPAAVIAGSALFGAGFGTLQNTTLTLMYARVQRADYSTASAIWNGAYDLGMAAGAIGVGLMIPATGYAVAFLITAVAMLPALSWARREQADPHDHRREHAA
jgi:predicted MFS family arabinose efflux permease